MDESNSDSEGASWVSNTFKFALRHQTNEHIETLDQDREEKNKCCIQVNTHYIQVQDYET